MKEHVGAICNSYSEVFFLQGARYGAFILLATLVNPNVAVAGIVASVATYVFAHFIHMGKIFLASGFYIYNPMLVGLSIGYLFRITPLTIFLIVAAAILTFLVTHLLQSVLAYYLRLPVLSLPFVIISSLVYLAASRYSNLTVNGLYPYEALEVESHIPFWVAGFLKSLAAILFVPNVVSGAILLLMILYVSRIMFLLAVLGYYAGSIITAFMVGSMHQAFADVNHFNFVWTALALGGIFLIPSGRSYVLSVIAVAVSTFVLTSVEVFWADQGIPVFALPFNLVTLAFLYVLGATNFPLLTASIKGTPEESLDAYLSNQLRFKGSHRTVQLPFAGKWTVWQGFDGPWTHKGAWSYAYDFVLKGDDGRTYRNDGSVPQDYHAYGKPVLSPVRGRVVRVVDSLPDNAVGKPDKTNNWGNHVILYDDRTFWVEISHFRPKTIAVREGQWVEKGEFIGHCGNSGYSPQPHIHIQVQASEQEGSTTLPFSFVDYVTGSRFHSNDLPAPGETVEPLQQDRAMDLRMSFILDESLRYSVRRNGTSVSEFTLKVKMAPDGTFYFSSEKGRLYYGKQCGSFFFYGIEGHDPCLEALFVALPRLPLAYREGLTWEDYVPVATVSRGLKKNLALFLGSFRHDLYKITVQCTYLDPQTIAGTVKSGYLDFSGETLVRLGDSSGLSTIQVNALEMQRI